MKIPIKILFLLFALLMAGQASWSADQDGNGAGISVILSADMPPYREALAGIEEAAGAGVSVSVLPERPVITSETRVVIALGIKAAQLKYPPDKPMVVALAPGLPRYMFADRTSTPVIVPMTPRPAKIAAALKKLQPDMKRFTVLWTTDSADFSLSDMISAAAAEGISCDPVRIDSPDDIPGTLRAITGRTNAILLPLDPALLTSGNFGILNEYSKGNAVPLYVSTDKLVQSGAAAGFSVSFMNMGRTAGLAAVGLASGKNVEAFRYPEKMEIYVNPESMGLIDKRITENAVKEGARVLTGK